MDDRNRINIIMFNSDGYPLPFLEKRSFTIGDELRTECKEFLSSLGYVCFTSYQHEAEAMCASITSNGRASATVSEGKGWRGRQSSTLL